MRIVGIGGGTGLPVLLRGLKEEARKYSGRGPTEIEISAIVSVFDSGGSSGLLRKAMGIPAVGDLRNCLVALSAEGSLLAELFQHRFSEGDGLRGHALGNLIMTALYQLTGSLRRTAELASELLKLKGSVLPSSEACVTLCAEFEDGSRAQGEAEIARAGLRVKRVWLEPKDPPPSDGVLEAIGSADVVVVGPGSLFTSILPNFLVSGVAGAIRASAALKIFVCNLMTEPGETDGLSAADHLRVLEEYLGPRSIDICLLNSRQISRALLRRYTEMGSEPVRFKAEEITRMGAVPIAADLLDENEHVVRHDSDKLAHLVIALTRGALRAQDIICGELAGGGEFYVWNRRLYRL